MSEDVFDCYSSEECMVTTCLWWIEVRDAVKHTFLMSLPTTKNYQVYETPGWFSWLSVGLFISA